MRVGWCKTGTVCATLCIWHGRVLSLKVVHWKVSSTVLCRCFVDSVIPLVRMLPLLNMLSPLFTLCWKIPLFDKYLLQFFFFFLLFEAWYGIACDLRWHEVWLDLKRKVASKLEALPQNWNQNQKKKFVIHKRKDRLRSFCAVTYTTRFLFFFFFKPYCYILNPVQSRKYNGCTFVPVLWPRMTRVPIINLARHSRNAQHVQVTPNTEHYWPDEHCRNHSVLW